VAEEEAQRSLLDRALDLVVFAPVGLVLTVREQLPAFAGRGRERIEHDLHNAKAVGELTVLFGRQEVQRRRNAGRGTISIAGTAAEAEAETTTARATARPGRQEPSGAPAFVAAPDDVTEVLRTDGVPVPDAATLAIPDYDTLSASQVVRRLTGLSRNELDTVRNYESHVRKRRTVLHRITELTNDPEASEHIGSDHISRDSSPGQGAGE
jgi:hypothetical protein